MEAILKEAGTCGRFQVVFVLLTQLPRFVSVWGIMLMVFGGFDPGWRCGMDGDGLMTSPISGSGGWAGMSATLPPSRVGGVDGNETTGGMFGGRNEEKDPESSGMAAGISRNTSLSLLEMDKGNQSHIHPRGWGGGNDNCSTVDLCPNDSIVFNPVSLTIVSEFKLICDREWILKVMLVTQSVGFLVGSLVGGQVGEMFGRKVSLYSGTAVVAVASGVAIFSFHWLMYAICLFFIGVGSYTILSTSLMFSMEYLNSKWRSVIGGVSAWTISLCLFTMCTVVMKSWVQVHVATCGMALLTCLGFFIVPESLRWLVVHGRQEKAETVIRKIARMNQKSPPSEGVMEALHRESDTEKNDVTYTYVDLFKQRSLRVKMMKIQTIFLIAYVTYFALSFGIKSLPGNFYVNLMRSSVCELIMGIVASYLGKKLGRRWSGFILSVCGAVSCAGIVVALFTSEGPVRVAAVSSFAFLAKGASNGMTIIASLFLAEHIPTAVRNVAGGLSRSMTVGGMLSPFLIPSSDTQSFAICFSIMSVCYITSLGIFLSLPETNRLCLLDGLGSSSENRKTEDECVL